MPLSAVITSRCQGCVAALQWELDIPCNLGGGKVSRLDCKMQITKVSCNMQIAFDAGEPANLDDTILCKIPNMALLGMRHSTECNVASCAVKEKGALGSPVWGCAPVPG